MQSGGRKLVSKGKENNTQSLAASKSNQVARFSFLGVSQEAAHFDREKKGGCASNANGLNCVGEGAVGCEKSGEIRGEGDNSGEGSSSFKFTNEWRVVLNVCINGEIGNAIRVGGDKLVIVVAFGKFLQARCKIVETVEGDKIKVI